MNQSTHKEEYQKDELAYSFQTRLEEAAALIQPESRQLSDLVISEGLKMTIFTGVGIPPCLPQIVWNNPVTGSF